jgi:heat shock protein 5
MLTKLQGKSETVTIRSDQGRLTPEEVKRMMADAEKYAEEDKATAERIRSRNELENYAFNLKNQVNDAGGVGGKLDDDEKETASTIHTLMRRSVSGQVDLTGRFPHR